MRMNEFQKKVLARQGAVIRVADIEGVQREAALYAILGDLLVTAANLAESFGLNLDDVAEEVFKKEAQ